jgi:hypothetical protein
MSKSLMNINIVLILTSEFPVSIKYHVKVSPCDKIGRSIKQGPETHKTVAGLSLVNMALVDEY